MRPFKKWTLSEKQEYWNNMIHFCNNSGTFQAVNHMEIATLTDSECVGYLNVDKTSLNPAGTVHGGCLLTLADTVGGCLVIAHGNYAVTLNCDYNYLRPAVGNRIKCTASMVKLGSKVSVVRVVMSDEKDEIIGSGCFNYFRNAEPFVEIYPESVKNEDMA